MSKALLVSIAISIVYCVSFEFKPFIIGWIILESEVAVEWLGLYLC